MTDRHGRSLYAGVRLCLASLGLLVLVATARCTHSGPISSPTATVLRVGVGDVAQLALQAGLQQYIGNLSIEGLVAPYEDGRPRPWLARSWTTSPDGLSLIVELRPGARFHDGTPVTASVVVKVLQSTLPGLMGPAFQDDVDHILALDDARVQI